MYLNKLVSLKQNSTSQFRRWYYSLSKWFGRLTDLCLLNLLWFLFSTSDVFRVKIGIRIRLGTMLCELTMASPIQFKFVKVLKALHLRCVPAHVRLEHAMLNRSHWHLVLKVNPFHPYADYIHRYDGHSCSGKTPDIAWKSCHKTGASLMKLGNGKRYSCKIDEVEVEPCFIQDKILQLYF